MGSERILVVDDEERNREFLKEFLEVEGFDVETAKDGQEAIGTLENMDFDLVLTDLKMPKADGLAVLEGIRRINPETVAIVFTGYGSIDTAVKAVKLGAYDYITKPLKIEEITLVIQRALEHRKLALENEMLRRQLKRKYKFDNIIGDAENMQDVFRLVEKIANTDSTVLIYGESGTGKELIARAIHFNSDRRERPLIPVNCGAIPEELLESELFGHEQGAFTGATRTRIGRFELGNGGTIFLDEIGDMSPALQVKVLRVLQEHEFERVGGMKTIKVDIRVIAATNKDLEKNVSDGIFREDLFYRLNVIPIQLPPLRQRKTDLPLLVNHFTQMYNTKNKHNITGVSPESIELLQTYDWPGNVRELENMIERIVILKGEGVVEPDDLSEKVLASTPRSLHPRIQIPENGISFNTAVTEFERELILQALNRTNWVKNKAAKLLNLNRTTLVEKMKKINLNRSS
jgi:DNA-binding NtrC family response regulator